MAWCMQCLDFNGTDVEGLAVTGRFRDFGAVAATNDGYLECLELGLASVVNRGLVKVLQRTISTLPPAWS